MEGLGSRPKDLVANLMTIGIIDLFEGVDIDGQDR
jgi:hypothetical protein